MFRQFPHFIFSLLLISAFALGCSSGSSPVSPDTSPPPTNPDTGITGQNEADISPTVLWGYFDLYFDLDAGEITAVPNRSMEYATNVVVFLNNNPLGVSVVFHGTTPGTGYVDIDMDVSITHPLADEKFNGYDVRGIFIGNGSDTLDYNPDLAYPVNGVDQVLLNADGYTRWWNPAEFITPGFMGYTPGILASKNYSATATLNGYKYFGDGLGAADNHWGYLKYDDGTNGYFIAGTTNTRNYIIRFMIPTPGIKYGYAVVANWKSGQPSDHPSHAAEALGMAVMDINALYYVDDTHNGGLLNMYIYIFDWTAEPTSGVMEEYTLILESTALSAPHVFTPSEMETPNAMYEHIYRYHIMIPADNISAVDGNEAWILVEKTDGDYTNPFGIPNSAGSDPLTAAFRYPLTIENELPTVTLTSPNGSEVLGTNMTETITWTSNNLGFYVDFYYSKDNFVSDVHEAVLNVVNSGQYLWWTVPDDVSDTVKLRIQASINPDLYDISDNDFSIVPANINITYPAGGENFLVGSSETILYDYTFVTGQVDIFYSKDGFVSDFNYITGGTPMDGSFVWDPIPDDTSSTVTLRIYSTGDQGVEDFSSDFTIYKPWIDITSPNGGEIWVAGTSHDITWDSSGILGTVFIEYSTDNFVSDINSIATDEPNDGTYTWDPVAPIVSDTVTVRISSTDDPTVNDRSDAYFSTIEGGWARTWDDLPDLDYTGMSVCFGANEKIYVAGSLYTSTDAGLFLRCYDRFGQLEWTRQYLDPACTGMMPAQMMMDSDDHLVIAGGFRGTIDFNPGLPGGQHISSGGGYDAMVVKYSNIGDYLNSVVWPIHTFSGLTLDPMDNIYLSGGFTGTDVDFDPDPVDTHLMTSNGDSDAYVFKIDPIFDFKWAASWGGANYDYTSGLGIYGQPGTIFAGGGFSGTNVDFDPSAATDLHSSLGVSDCFLTKFLSDGTYDGSVAWGGTEWDVVQAVGVSDAGFVYPGGYFSGSVDFDPDPVDTDIIASSGSSACFISWYGPNLEYSGTGIVESDGNDNIGDIVTGTGYSVYIYGTFDGTTIDINPGPGTDDRTGIAQSSWLISLSETLGYHWGHVLDYTGADDAFIGLAALEDKAIAVTGELNQTTNLAPSDPPCSEDPDMQGNPMYQDGYLIKYFANGCWQQ